MSDHAPERRMLLLNLKASVRALNTACAQHTHDDESAANLKDAIDSVVDSVVMALEYGYSEDQPSGSLWAFIANVFSEDPTLRAEIEDIQESCKRQTDALREWVLQGLQQHRLSSYIATLARHPGTHMHYDENTLLKHSRDLENFRFWIASVENSTAFQSRTHRREEAPSEHTLLATSLPRWPGAQRDIMNNSTSKAPRSIPIPTSASASSIKTISNGAFPSQATLSSKSSLSNMTVLGSSLPSSSSLNGSVFRDSSRARAFAPLPRITDLRESSGRFDGAASPAVKSIAGSDVIAESLSPIPTRLAPALDASGYDTESTVVQSENGDDSLQNRTSTAFQHGHTSISSSSIINGSGIFAEHISLHEASSEAVHQEQGEGEGDSLPIQGDSLPVHAAPLLASSPLHSSAAFPHQTPRSVSQIDLKELARISETSTPSSMFSSEVSTVYEGTSPEKLPFGMIEIPEESGRARNGSLPSPIAPLRLSQEEEQNRQHNQAGKQERDPPLQRATTSSTSVALAENDSNKPLLPVQSSTSSLSTISRQASRRDRLRARLRLPKCIPHEQLKPFLDRDSLNLEQEQPKNFRSFTVSSSASQASAVPETPRGRGESVLSNFPNTDVRIIHVSNIGSSHHLMTSAELDRENRHFSVAEAIIEAMEATKQEYDYLLPADNVSMLGSSTPFSPYLNVNYPSANSSLLNTSIYSNGGATSPVSMRRRAPSGFSEKTAGSGSTPTASSHSHSTGHSEDATDLASTLSEGSMLMSAHMLASTNHPTSRLHSYPSNLSSSSSTSSHARRGLFLDEHTGASIHEEDEERGAEEDEGGMGTETEIEGGRGRGGGDARGRSDSTASSIDSSSWISVDHPERRDSASKRREKRNKDPFQLNSSLNSSADVSTSPTNIARCLLYSNVDLVGIANGGSAGGHNVTQSLKFLIGDDDNVPQSLIPMPAISLGAFSQAAKGGRPLMEMIEHPMSPRIRGNEEWAPPRRQIIFNIHDKPKRSQAMSKQNYKCAGCGLTVQTSFAKLFHYCEYLGKYFCSSCHRKHVSVIPARVLWRWDFKQYPVSNFSRDLINSISNDPVFDIMSVNPALVKKVKQLGKAQRLRAQLSVIRPYIQTCRNGTDLMSEIDKAPHTATDINVYTLNELKDVEKGVYVERLQSLINSCIEHIRSCPLCTAKGFICEFCNNERDIIFPFDFVKNIQCKDCKDVFHRKCFVKANKGCPRCLRFSERRSKSNATRSQYLPTVPQPLALDEEESESSKAAKLASDYDLHHEFYEENEFEIID